MGSASQKKAALEALKLSKQWEKDLRKAFENGQKDGIYKTFNLVYWTLHVKYGFGEKRLANLHKEVMFLLDCEEVSIKDIEEALKDECNITFAKDEAK